MNTMPMLRDRRTTDTFFDRRSGNDRRAGYEAGYFSQGGLQRRKGLERRQKFERRDQYVRINKWASICANPRSLGEYERAPERFRLSGASKHRDPGHP